MAEIVCSPAERMIFAICTRGPAAISAARKYSSRLIRTNLYKEMATNKINAPIKIFVTASVEKRANRRWKELQNMPLQHGVETVTETAVLADMKERDERDTSRAAAPAKPAPDAFILDTSEMTADQAFVAALALAESKLPPAND